MRTINVCLSLFLLFVTVKVSHAQKTPWPIRAVIVTTFEVGSDTGDVPGEFQFWVEREHLNETLDFPGGVHVIRTNADHTVLGIVSGTTLVNATASLMALGLDPRFDLTHTYWLINGIAGVDPNDASIGSAAWATYVVSDVAREIDAREIPSDWPTGYFARNTKRPYDPKKPEPTGELFHLNPALTEWAYQLTRNVVLDDSESLKTARARVS